MEEKKSPKANLENRKFLFITIGAVFSLSLMLVSLEWTQKLPKREQTQEVVAATEEEMVAPTRQQQVQPPPPPPPPPPQITDQIEIVDNTVHIDDQLDFHSDADASTANTDFKITDKGAGSGDEAAETDNEIFIIVEKMPVFPGNIMQWIGKNLRYPPVAADNGIQGRVTVQFVIGKDGKVTDVKVSRGVDPSLDKEAIRVVSSMPAWTPGEQRGKKVRVSFSVPINFQLR